jgi:diguanylate cyclase (GGDEF)-like protein
MPPGAARHDGTRQDEAGRQAASARPGVDHAHAPALDAVERERFESYSELVRNLHWLAAALVLLFATLDQATARLPLYGLAAAMVVYTLALHSSALAGLSGRARVGIETALDLAWVTAVIAVSGGSSSPLFFLYYAVLFATTPEGGRGLTYLKASAATFLACGAVLFELEATTNGAGWLATLFGELLWPLAGLWLVAYFAAESGSLGTQLHRSLFLAAHTDALTGLPNMRYFTALADLRGRLGQPYTIVMVDADRLKHTNDTWGHAKGSELIRRVGEALRRGARSGDDLCSRLGGDEFIVRLNGAAAEGSLAYCRRVRAFLAAHPLEVEGGTVPVSVSMGIAAFPEHGRTLSEVIERADEALYRSKQMGRGVSCSWSPEGGGPPLPDRAEGAAIAAAPTRLA